MEKKKGGWGAKKPRQQCHDQIGHHWSIVVSICKGIKRKDHLSRLLSASLYVVTI